MQSITKNRGYKATKQCRELEQICMCFVLRFVLLLHRPTRIHPVDEQFPFYKNIFKMNCEGFSEKYFLYPMFILWGISPQVRMDGEHEMPLLCAHVYRICSKSELQMTAFTRSEIEDCISPWRASMYVVQFPIHGLI